MSSIRGALWSLIVAAGLAALGHMAFATVVSCTEGCLEFKDKSPPVIDGGSCVYYVDEVVMRRMIAVGNDLRERGTVLRTGWYTAPLQSCVEACSADGAREASWVDDVPQGTFGGDVDLATKCREY